MNRTSTGTGEDRKAMFLEFVERERGAHLALLTKVLGERPLAEDLLQEATLKALGKLDSLRDSGALSGWFRTILKSAAFDHHRRTKVRERALEALVHELGDDGEDSLSTPCACASALKKTLKPEYEDALERIEIEGMKVSAFASERGISNSNAGVRVHRAREALREKVEATCGACAKAGCFSCTCERS